MTKKPKSLNFFNRETGLSKGFCEAKSGVPSVLFLIFFPGLIVWCILETFEDFIIY